MVTPKVVMVTTKAAMVTVTVAMVTVLRYSVHVARDFIFRSNIGYFNHGSLKHYKWCHFLIGHLSSRKVRNFIFQEAWYFKVAVVVFTIMGIKQVSEIVKRFPPLDYPIFRKLFILSKMDATIGHVMKKYRTLLGQSRWLWRGILFSGYHRFLKSFLIC